MREVSCKHHSANQLLVVLSGPSGTGKDAVLAKLKESGYPLRYITTMTTRPQRASEKNKVDYHFISMERFQAMVENKEFLEWANVFGNWYGVPRQAVKQALDEGQDIMLKVDIQGAATIKKIIPEAIFIFIMPPSIEELSIRLKQRRSESSDNLDLRLKAAEDEIKQLPLFDYIVINNRNDIDTAVSQIKAIIAAEKCRVTPRQITI